MRDPQVYLSVLRRLQGQAAEGAPLKRRMAVLEVAEDGAIAADVLSQPARLLMPDTLVLCLDVPTLLADRLGPGRALLRLLLEGSKPKPWLTLMRRVAGAGREPESWCLHTLGLSLQGAQRIAGALKAGDFGARRSLTLRQEEEEELFNGEFADIPLPVLGEADAQRVVSFLLSSYNDGSVQLWLTRCEVLVLEESPHRQGFIAGLRRLLQSLHDKMPRVSMAMFAWAGAASMLRGLDPALGMVRERCGLRWTGPTARQAMRLPDFKKVLAQNLVRAPFKAWNRPESWCSLEEGRDLLLLWPLKTRDPADEVIDAIGELADVRSGVQLVALVPSWAAGEGTLASRLGLSRAFPFMTWVIVPSWQAWLLSEGHQKLAQSLLHEIKEGWASSE